MMNGEQHMTITEAHPYHFGGSLAAFNPNCPKCMAESASRARDVRLSRGEPVVKIYVASSWRNAHQPAVVDHLRSLGHECYDFRNPPNGVKGFAWSDIDPKWLTWTPSEWKRALDHPLAVSGFANDLGGMEWADACVLVLPSGRSSHLEAGWMTAKGKPTAVLALEPVEPDLMVGLCDRVVTSMSELDVWLVDRIIGGARRAVQGRPLCSFSLGVPVIKAQNEGRGGYTPGRVVRECFTGRLGLLLSNDCIDYSFTKDPIFYSADDWVEGAPRTFLTAPVGSGGAS